MSLQAFCRAVVAVALWGASLAHAASPLRLVSAPTPNVFPLLLAIARHPELPVQLVPLRSTGSELDDEFEMGEADGMLGMTYAIAQKVSSGKLPDLRLRGVTFWRGFFAMLPASSRATSLAQLAGKGLIVSGPLSGGRGGAPDLLFQAALHRAGRSTADCLVCYLPAAEGIAWMARQTPMNGNAGCDKAYNGPATAMFLVEPAATGLVMKSGLPFVKDVPIKKAISIEALFTGYKSWPAGQLPQGGWALRATTVADPQRRVQVDAIEHTLNEAAQELAEISGKGLISRLLVAWTLSTGLDKAYGQWGIHLPTLVLAQALGSGDLVYRADLPVTSINGDLRRFLAEVLKVQDVPERLFSALD